MKLTFINKYEDSVPLKIVITIGNDPEDEWYGYSIGLFMGQESPYLEAQGAFTLSCIEALAKDQMQILEGKSQVTNYEPMEPAFQLKMERMDDETIRMHLLVDVGFVRNLTATETGVGISIDVDPKQLTDSSGRLKEFLSRQ